MKGFVTTLIVVCAVIGGLWFAYEPYIKPMLEKAPSMSESETLLTNGGSEESPSKKTKSSPAKKSPPGTAASKQKSSTPIAKGSASPKLSELDQLLVKKYPMPEFVPLMQIVDNWKNVPPRAYPPEVFAKETISFQLVVNGQAIGSSNVAPGTPLKPTKLIGDQLTIANQANPGMNKAIPVDQTDFKERITKRYNDYVAKVKGDIEARRAQVKRVVQADPAKLAILKGEKPPASSINDSDPRFSSVKNSLRSGEAASVTLEEATSFSWNGSEKIGGDYAGTYDTVTVHFEVKTIFGRFPVEYKALVRGNKVVAWIDPITEDRI